MRGGLIGRGVKERETNSRADGGLITNNELMIYVSGVEFSGRLGCVSAESE